MSKDLAGFPASQIFHPQPDIGVFPSVFKLLADRGFLANGIYFRLCDHAAFQAPRLPLPEIFGGGF
jgi:hypothetical protein